jgi:1-acyl-sn-glycerol-3-phosphate acyltransferase
VKGFLKHPWRVTVRLFWLAGEILLALLDFVINVIFAPKVPLARARALWLQQACRRVLRILNAEVTTRGPIPLKGLLVSNHLSYLDILVLSATTPAVFISKSDVKRWPVFGWFAVLSGTLFVERARRSDVARLNREVARVLDLGGLVVLFPEGTSSDGRQVLPFKSSLLEPITRLQHPLSIACIAYGLPDGDPAEDVCYWGDMTLAPHLVNLFSKSKVTVSVSFTRLEDSPNTRKELARHLHLQVLRLKEESVLTTVVE